MSGSIAPCLWFDGQAEAAAHLYAGVFADSSVDKLWRAGDGLPMPADTVMLVEFTLRGQPFQVLNGGPGFPHTQAISMSVDCADQAEMQRTGTPEQVGRMMAAMMTMVKLDIAALQAALVGEQ